LPLVSITLTAFVSTSVLADDVRPPEYRGLPLSIYAEWQNVSQVPAETPTLADVFVPDFTQENPLFPGFETNLVCFPESEGTRYVIEMQNIVDELPLKFLRVQVTAFSIDVPPAEPFVNVIGSDPSLTPPDSVAVSGGLTEVVDLDDFPPDFADVFVYDFVLEPNPDYEIIDIFVPEGTVVEQIVVDSISTVPEPATAALLAGGLMLVVAFWRRRRRG
jgi:hypothetical protein